MRGEKPVSSTNDENEYTNRFHEGLLRNSSGSFSPLVPPKPYQVCKHTPPRQNSSSVSCGCWRCRIAKDPNDCCRCMMSSCSDPPAEMPVGAPTPDGISAGITGSCIVLVATEANGVMCGDVNKCREEVAIVPIPVCVPIVWLAIIPVRLMPCA